MMGIVIVVLAVIACVTTLSWFGIALYSLMQSPVRSPSRFDDILLVVSLISVLLFGATVLMSAA